MVRTRLDLLRISKEVSASLQRTGRDPADLPVWDVSAGWPDPQTATVYRVTVPKEFVAVASTLDGEIGLRLAGMLRLKVDPEQESPWAFVPDAMGEGVWLVFTRPAPTANPARN